MVAGLEQDGYMAGSRVFLGWSKIATGVEQR
jgi:hypothetical protein